MNITFLIQSEPPNSILQAATQPEPADLSLDELRICFPVEIAFVSSGAECFVLNDAPVIGVIVELSESLLRLTKGEGLVEVLDFYGEYKLVFRKQGEVIECKNEFVGKKFQTSFDAFQNEAKRWSDDELRRIEGQFMTIIANPNYHRLKEQIAQTWKSQGL